jgi:hypothetical protein
VKAEWDRFWEKVEIADCWTWQACLVGGGYGWFARKGDGSKLAHRWTWETLVGPIPDGLDLDHLCRNRACVNPDHLEPVTRRENLLRGATRTAAAAAATHCPANHPYDEANTGYQNGGDRYCRVCKRARMREYYQRKRARAAA